MQIIFYCFKEPYGSTSDDNDSPKHRILQHREYNKSKQIKYHLKELHNIQKGKTTLSEISTCLRAYTKQSPTRVTGLNPLPRTCADQVIPGYGQTLKKRLTING